MMPKECRLDPLLSEVDLLEIQCAGMKPKSVGNTGSRTRDEKGIREAEVHIAVVSTYQHSPRFPSWR